MKKSNFILITCGIIGIALSCATPLFTRALNAVDAALNAQTASDTVKPAPKQSVHENVYSYTYTNTTLYTYKNGVWAFGDSIQPTIVMSSSDPNYKYYYSDTTYYRGAYVNGHLETRVKEATGLNFISSTNRRTLNYNNFNVIFDTYYFSSTTVPIDNSIKGTNGYTLKTYRNSIFVYADSRDGYYLAINKLLEGVYGFNPIRGDYAVYSKTQNPTNGDTIKLPNFNIKEVPDFKTRKIGSNVSSRNSSYPYDYDFGYTIEQYFKESSWNYTNFHNSVGTNNTGSSGWGIVDLNEKGTHPKWFTTFGSGKTDICFTAHGDTNEYNALVQYIANKCIDNITNSYRRDMYARHISLAVQDGLSQCTCTECTRMKNRHGSLSATIVKLMSDVADIFYTNDRVLADQALYGPSTVGFLAYQNYGMAPSNYISELGINPKLRVYVAPSRVGNELTDWSTPLSSNINSIQTIAYNNFKTWSSLFTDATIGFYGYTANFQNYMCPFDSFSTTIANLKIAYDQNADWAFFNNDMGGLSSGQNERLSTGFTNFKFYLEAKAMVNTTLSLVDIEKMYFNDAFGKASSIMYNAYNSITEVLRMQRRSGLIDGKMNQVSSNIDDEDTWFKDIFTFEFLKNYANNIDRALELEKNNALIKRGIQAEAMFPHFFLLRYFGNSLSSQETTKYRQMLKEECVACNVTTWKEADGYGTSSSLANIFYSWWGNY